MHRDDESEPAHERLDDKDPKRLALVRIGVSDESCGTPWSAVCRPTEPTDDGRSAEDGHRYRAVRRVWTPAQTGDGGYVFAVYARRVV